MIRRGLSGWLQPRLPFYYGWVILACICCVGFARQGPAVATLSIFIEPMTSEFGWSHTAMSAAVSLGGILAALTSPMLGPVLDRHGARAMLCWAVLTTAICTMVLAWTQSLVFFFVFFCIARMNFAGTFDLGIYGALNNWFVRRRGIATSISTVSLMIGLIAMPLIVQAAIVYDGWRAGWLAVGFTVLVIGFLPTWALMVRRPEDMGLVPDGPMDINTTDGNGATTIAEPTFTRAQALRTPAFWLLSLFTLLSYPVQAGVSLHQAPHLIERGIDPTTAAFIVSTFSLTSAVSGFGFGLVVRSWTVRVSLALTAVGLGGGTAIMIWTYDALTGYAGAALFGLGIGGILTVLPIAWADYFGRRSFGAIRGIALSIQVVAQAMGPLMSGILRDYTGDYVLSLWVFVGVAGLAALAALLTAPPKPPGSDSGSPA